MLLEGIISAACIYGNGDACKAGVDGYVKYNHLDDRFNEFSRKIKKAYPEVYYSGIVVASAVKRQYNGIIYKNIGFNIDLGNPDDKRFTIFYKYGF